MKRLLIAAISLSLVGIAILAGPSATGRQPQASGDSGTGSSPAGSAPWSATNALAGDSNTPAEGTLRNDELVVASLDPLGLPVTANLISRVSSSGGPQRTIVDPTSTSNIAYLNRRGQPTVVGKGIEVTVGGQEPVVIITKAEFDRTLPVALHAEYVLNGQVVDPQDVVGASGDVTIRFTVTNVDVKQQKLRYTDSSGKSHESEEPIFAPFVGTLTTVLPGEYDITSSKDAVASTDGKGNTVLTWSLLLYPPLGDYRQVVSFGATTESAVVPMTTLAAAPVSTNQDPAVAFSADMFGKSLDGNKELTDAVSKLDDGTLSLADGAAKLAAGLYELDQGLGKASDGVSDQLVPGTIQVAVGASAIAVGQGELTTAVGTAADGAGELYSGAQELAVGLAALSAGLDILANTALPEIRDGAKKLKSGTVELSEAVGSPTDPPIPIPTTTPIPTPTASITLVQAIRGAVLAAQVLTVQAETLATNLAPIFATIDTSAITSGTARDRADDATDALDALLVELCPTPPTITPQQCADMEQARVDSSTAAADAGTVSDDLTDASVLADTELLRAQGIAVALDYFEQFLKEIRAGILEVSVALRSGSYVPGEEGLVEGLTELVDALRLTVAATKILDKGGDAALAGAKELAAGNLALSNGLDATDAGARQLTRATDKLAAGASEVAFGSVEVAAALKALTEGAGQATTGAGDLASGAEELQQQGTRKMLESVIESSQQPALANAWLAAASARAPEALPYGQPKGADGSAAYVMTMDPVGPSDSWAWQIAAILILGVSAVAGAALKQSLATRREERG